MEPAPFCAAVELLQYPLLESLLPAPVPLTTCASPHNPEPLQVEYGRRTPFSAAAMASAPSEETPRGESPDAAKAEIRFMDLVQMDIEDFNATQRQRQKQYQEEHGAAALRSILYGDVHHELKAQRTADYSLSEAEMQHLVESKVLIKSQEGPTSFARIMQQLYNNDMPLFVTSDCVLYAFHRFYDNWLKEVEISKLTGQFRSLCQELLEQLHSIPRTGKTTELLRDLEVYFTVPLAVLDGALVGADRRGRVLARDLPKLRYGGATALQKTMDSILRLQDMEVCINGVNIILNGSSMKPRGHYTESPELRSYFTAFTWLACFVVPIKLDETKMAETIAAVQLASALAKVAKPCMGKVAEFFAFIRLLVGEPDSYTLPTFLPVIDELVPDEHALDWIVEHGPELTEAVLPKLDKVSSLTTLGAGSTAETPWTFSLIGRGSNIDNFVIQRMVDEHLHTDEGSPPVPWRKVPRVHDLVYTLFDNDGVGAVLEEEMATLGYTYWQHLRSVRDEAAGHEYPRTLYNQELKMLRALGQDRALQAPFQTRAWKQKQAATQIAHYAELRHDNVLYVAECFGAMCCCEHADIMIEPVPLFWEEFAKLVDMMIEIAGPSRVLMNFKHTIGNFREFLRQQEGGSVNPDLVEALKSTVQLRYMGSGPPNYGGWYLSLFDDPERAFEQAAEVSSMFTAPPDIRGPGKILHLGTGVPNLMYILVSEENGGEKVLVGPTYSAYEVVTDYDDRMNDEEWRTRVQTFQPVSFTSRP
eukprot:scaffold3870_cov246-Pinguiococcus_pyrenoidosus.AAC.10